MTLPTWISHEPVAWVNALAALLDVGVILFPHFLTPEQKAAILIAIPLIANLVVTRQAVTPNAKVAAAIQAAVPGAPTIVPPPA